MRKITQTLFSKRWTWETLIQRTSTLYNNSVFKRNSSSKIVSKKTASDTYRVMNIFDRKAKFLQRERSALREDYHLCEYIKEEIGWRTADRVFDIKRTFYNAVELGK